MKNYFWMGVQSLCISVCLLAVIFWGCDFTVTSPDQRNINDTDVITGAGGNGTGSGSIPGDPASSLTCIPVDPQNSLVRITWQGGGIYDFFFVRTDGLTSNHPQLSTGAELDLGPGGNGGGTWNGRMIDPDSGMIIATCAVTLES
jgi:hypothetical protein